MSVRENFRVANWEPVTKKKYKKLAEVTWIYEKSLDRAKIHVCTECGGTKFYVVKEPKSHKRIQRDVSQYRLRFVCARCKWGFHFYYR